MNFKIKKTPLSFTNEMWIKMKDRSIGTVRDKDRDGGIDTSQRQR